MAKPPIKNADDAHDRTSRQSQGNGCREPPTARAGGGTGTDVNTTTGGGGGVRGVGDDSNS